MLEGIYGVAEATDGVLDAVLPEPEPDTVPTEVADIACTWPSEICMTTEPDGLGVAATAVAPRVTMAKTLYCILIDGY